MPAAPRVPPARGWLSPWPWFLAAAAVAVVPIWLLVAELSALHEASFFNLNTVPTAQAWSPDASYYCASVGALDGQYPDRFLVAFVVNAAPNAAAHKATWAFYDDLVAGRSTTADMLRVLTAYSCSANSGSSPG